MNTQKKTIKPYIGLVGFSMLLILSGMDVFLRAIGATFALYGLYEIKSTREGSMSVPKIHCILKIIIGLAAFFIPELIMMIETII